MLLLSLPNLVRGFATGYCGLTSRYIPLVVLGVLEVLCQRSRLDSGARCLVDTREDTKYQKLGGARRNRRNTCISFGGTIIVLHLRCHVQSVPGSVRTPDFTTT